ncbi:hypothetical protein [Zunongwangia atlantica]|uniref:Uncharacterized protein n=1 Tax=Zunongwangia atlantica 22II14-10F7 TaxID=1185767 RepID=A0A1Y1T0D3_9FLAO|nr:hypothetical protein [Zunongwangia atlantica]ORL43953.1 hypothetical protein IIF7_18342 [Zunongwangia atlantica 22II14-10F7]
MKLGVLLSSFFLLIITATCNNQKVTSNMKLTGLIEAAGITSYQYGSHVLRTDDKTYALTSGKIDLTELEGQTITIIAEKIDGYPVEGGPEYIKVLEVEE